MHGNLYFLLHNNSVHIILFKLKKVKFFIGRKKKTYRWRRSQNRYFVMQIITMKTATIWTLYVHVDLNSVIFDKFYMILFYMLDAFYLSSFFQSICLRNYASSYRRI